MSLKDNIKQRRLARGLTLEDVAKHVGVSRQTVQKYESGVVANIPSDKIEKIAEVLGTTPSSLMGWESSAKKQSKQKATEDDIKFALFNGDVDEITDEMYEDVKRFAQFIKEKKNGENSK